MDPLSLGVHISNHKPSALLLPMNAYFFRVFLIINFQIYCRQRSFVRDRITNISSTVFWLDFYHIPMDLCISLGVFLIISFVNYHVNVVYFLSTSSTTGMSLVWKFYNQVRCQRRTQSCLIKRSVLVQAMIQYLPLFVIIPSVRVSASALQMPSFCLPASTLSMANVYIRPHSFSLEMKDSFIPSLALTFYFEERQTDTQTDNLIEERYCPKCLPTPLPSRLNPSPASHSFLILRKPQAMFSKRLPLALLPSGQVFLEELRNIKRLIASEQNVHTAAWWWMGGEKTYRNIWEIVLLPRPKRNQNTLLLM